jgi:ankyrin repeat protein
VFEGGGFVVAAGRHTDTADPRAVRGLAKKFVAADFYSMNDEYRAGVTDNPTYTLSISIDDHTKRVLDYVGSWVGMPAVISDLEDEVDSFARTERWVEGTDGLVPALQAEGFNFRTFAAQVMLKEGANRGETATIRELLAAGVPLEPLPAPKPRSEYEGIPFENEGWLNAAGANPDALRVLILAGASKNDQKDKDLALFGAANSGNLEAAQELIAYGANPNVDLSKLIVTEHWGNGMTAQRTGAGSVLTAAASSGNPELVREVLRYHPKLETGDYRGKTAMFAAGDWRFSDKDGARVECVRLLAQAGANVNARDNDGNTPLHETFLTDVEEELLKLGADVNARNKDGETPIFTTVDDDAISLFIAHGADLTIRNKKGQTVVEAAKEKGPQRQAALQKAIQQSNKH